MILVLLVNHYSEFRDSQLMLTQKQRDLDRLLPLSEFIEGHYMAAISGERAADVVNMSKSHFMRFSNRSPGNPSWLT